MKKLLYSLLLITCVTRTLAMEEEQKKMHVLFPLEGIFTPDTQKALSQLGLSGTLSAAWTGGFSGLWKTVTTQVPDQTAVMRRVFELMAEIEYKEVQDTEVVPEVYWHDLKTPVIFIHALLQGNKTCKEMHNLVVPYVDANASATEKASVYMTADMMLTPTKTADIFKKNNETIALIKALKEKGHTVHIADNLHYEPLVALQEKHKDVFDLINGHIMVSGHKEVKNVKAFDSCAFHEEFFEKHKDVRKEECIFIETEEKHLNALTDKPFQHLLLKDGNIKKLRKSLKEMGLVA